MTQPLSEPDPATGARWVESDDDLGAWAGYPSRAAYRPENPGPYVGMVGTDRAPGPYDVVGAHWGTRLMPAQQASVVAVWALVAGLVAVFAGWCLLGLPCLAAIVLGHVAESQTRDGMMSGRGQAVAGLAMGYLSLVPAALVLLWVVPVPQS